MRRVRYEANVYIRGPRQDRAVVARAHNLSAEGIAVSALELPAEGEEVECRLILGGRRTKLRGRVAWVHRAPPSQRTLPLGGGIQFISLDGSERELLSRLVDNASDGPQLCEVWVPGMEHPLHMRALIGTDEVKLGMRLPQLSVGMPVRISFVHRGVSESRQGAIEAVRFLPGDRETMSRVALQVATPRPRQDSGLIRGPAHAPMFPIDLGPGAQSMQVDLAVLSVPPGLAGAPGMGTGTPAIGTPAMGTGTPAMGTGMPAMGTGMPADGHAGAWPGRPAPRGRQDADHPVRAAAATAARAFRPGAGARQPYPVGVAGGAGAGCRDGGGCLRVHVLQAGHHTPGPGGHATRPSPVVHAARVDPAHPRSPRRGQCQRQQGDQTQAAPAGRPQGQHRRSGRHPNALADFRVPFGVH